MMFIKELSVLWWLLVGWAVLMSVNFETFLVLLDLVPFWSLPSKLFIKLFSFSPPIPIYYPSHSNLLSISPTLTFTIFSTSLLFFILITYLPDSYSHNIFFTSSFTCSSSLSCLLVANIQWAPLEHSSFHLDKLRVIRWEGLVMFLSVSCFFCLGMVDYYDYIGYLCEDVMTFKFLLCSELKDVNNKFTSNFPNPI